MSLSTKQLARSCNGSSNAAIWLEDMRSQFICKNNIRSHNPLCFTHLFPWRTWSKPWRNSSYGQERKGKRRLINYHHLTILHLIILHHHHHYLHITTASALARRPPSHRLHHYRHGSNLNKIMGPSWHPMWNPFLKWPIKLKLIRFLHMRLLWNPSHISSMQFQNLFMGFQSIRQKLKDQRDQGDYLGVFLALVLICFAVCSLVFTFEK